MSELPKVPYVRLGKSGLKVSKIILGCMSYGSQSEWMISDHDKAIEQIKYAYDLGINTFDTADVYSAGESEIILGKFLKKYKVPRESVVILTKTFNRVGKEEDKGPAGYTNHHGLSRKRIFASIKDSLERLQLDYVDVLQCHRFDRETPIEETMQALHDVVQAGYCRYIGMSSCWAWQFQIMQQYAINNRLTPFISMQNQHNAMYREEEREMMPTLEYFGVGSIPWGPIAAGLLCRPYSEASKTTRGQERLSRDQSAKENDKPIIDYVEQLAASKKVSMAQIAVAWSLHSKWVCAPIVGTTSNSRLEELVKGLAVELSEEEVKKFDELYKPGPIKGHT